ncbi:13212_t:CDS:2, partial [Gigaspora margarita]
DPFDDWLSVDTFIHQYCLEHGFGYQIFCNDKDPDNPFITYYKSFRCSSSGTYKAQKSIDQNSHRLCDSHNHKLNPIQIANIISRYRRLSDEMIKKLKFLTSYVYNTIYKNCNSRNEIISDSGLFLNALIEKVHDTDWKVFVWHTSDEHRLSALVEDEIVSTYKWILQCLMKATGLINAAAQYCKLIDLKDQYMTIGLPHISSQFFSSVDAVLVQFLTPPVLLWQRFQISQSFTYEEDVLNEPQATLQSLLSSTEFKKIIKTWRIHCIDGLSSKENLVALFANGTHICACMKTITKGIICQHFWRVMLYSHFARFHISIIPSRWYKDNIHTKLDFNVKNSPVLSVLESPSNTKTAINIALENNKDAKLVQLLKDFIAASQKEHEDNIDEAKE